MSDVWVNAYGPVDPVYIAEDYGGWFYAHDGFSEYGFLTATDAYNQARGFRNLSLPEVEEGLDEV